MKIQLDHIQRLNLHALLGAQRGDVATIRALWALQDTLACCAPGSETITGPRRMSFKPKHIEAEKELRLS